MMSCVGYSATPAAAKPRRKGWVPMTVLVLRSTVARAVDQECSVEF
jgi:hypothetical protein